MLPYLCVSHAVLDADMAERFCAELSAYGFRALCVDETVPSQRRDAVLQGAEILLVLTSPEAAHAESCASDIRQALGRGMTVLCVSMAPSELEERFGGTDGDCSGDRRGAEFIPHPYASSDTPDAGSVSLYIHRLYIRHLCRLAGTFDPEACVDGAYGCTIRCGVGAWGGQRDDQYALGCAYADGVSLPMQDNEAAFWIGKAAEARQPDALIRMAELRLDGAGTPRDPAEALRLYTIASQAKDPRGYYGRALCCLHGYGMMKDPELAVRYMRVAANAGYAPAQYRLGLLCRDGIGTPKSWHDAVYYLYLASGEGGHLYGYRPGQRYRCVSMRHMRQIRLGDLLTGGAHRHDPVAAARVKVCMKKSRYHAVSYPEDAFLDALDTAYDSARYNLTRGYSRRRWDPALASGELAVLLAEGCRAEGVFPSPTRALIWYRRAIRRGHSGAMYRLGNAYRAGQGVPASPVRAVRLFKSCAAFGNEQGQFAMGVCCEQGIGIPPDPAAAVRWYEMAARTGYAPAQNNLGGCYEQGRGVTVDIMVAVEWYARAASSGQPDATCRLGICYELGAGVERDRERALHLYENAARQGHAYALYRLGVCYDRGMAVEVQFAYAAHLYERAAHGGVAEAAYAMGLCCRSGRGVRRDAGRCFEWFRAASDRGSVQASYEAGMCYFEGRGTVIDPARALDCFARARELYLSRRAMHGGSREMFSASLPSDGLGEQEAARLAMYMLGYCTLYGYDTDHTLLDGTPIERAVEYFDESAEAGYCAAMTAIGDLYTYHYMTPDLSDPVRFDWLMAGDHTGEDETEAYVASVRTFPAKAAYERAGEGGCVNALLSVAVIREQSVGVLLGKGDREGVRAVRAEIWRALARCCEQGDPAAMLRMAVCAFRGYGVREDRQVALRFLERAYRKASENGIMGCCAPIAALWMGDFYRSGWLGEPDIAMADQCYRMAIDARESGSIVADPDTKKAVSRHIYVIRERLNARVSAAKEARAEAFYRLAVLRSVYADAGQGDAFRCLCDAILMGHETACADLARMLVGDQESRATLQLRDDGKAAKVARKKKRTEPVDSPEGDLPARHMRWMQAYYGAVMPAPEPFTLASAPATRPSAEDRPAYLTASVTDAMRAEALNHLGDCLFYGWDTREDHAAAVACYRKAAAVRYHKNAPIWGAVQAQYSLGWCLLHGVGVARDARAAVTHLKMAANHDAEAGLCLAECYERGVGVDRQDILEAINYYRKAARLGHPAASARMKMLVDRVSDL